MRWESGTGVYAWLNGRFLLDTTPMTRASLDIGFRTRFVVAWCVSVQVYGATGFVLGF